MFRSEVFLDAHYERRHADKAVSKVRQLLDACAPRAHRWLPIQLPPACLADYCEILQCPGFEVPPQSADCRPHRMQVLRYECEVRMRRCRLAHHWPPTHSHLRRPCTAASRPPGAARPSCCMVRWPGLQPRAGTLMPRHCADRFVAKYCAQLMCASEARTNVWRQVRQLCGGRSAARLTPPRQLHAHHSSIHGDADAPAAYVDSEAIAQLSPLLGACAFISALAFYMISWCWGSRCDVAGTRVPLGNRALARVAVLRPTLPKSQRCHPPLPQSLAAPPWLRPRAWRSRHTARPPTCPSTRRRLLATRARSPCRCLCRYQAACARCGGAWALPRGAAARS